MAEYDAEVSRAIWNGKIPIQFTFAATDQVTPAEMSSIPVFMQVARNSYLPVITRELQALFPDANLDETEVWYEYKSQPLKWHHPIGLLYDLHISLEEDDTLELPWHITVHTSGFPSDRILRLPSMEIIQDMFMSMIKEADFLRHGTTKKVMNLSKKDQIQLWQSLLKDQYDEYWDVNKRLFLDPGGPPMRHVPLRLYLPDLQCPPIQELVKYDHDNDDDNSSAKGSPKTIGQVLHEILPDIFPSSSSSCSSNSNSGVPIIHGIVLPLDTPLHWASLNLAFADHFLHIVINKTGLKQ